MGRRNKQYHKDLKQQIYEKLTEMLNKGMGKSKKAAKASGNDKNMIFSYSTYQSYWKHCKYFAEYLAEKHPECTTLKAARKYVAEWIKYRIEHGGKNGKPLSAYTITLEREALCKLFGISPDDKDFVQVPKRRREDIKRSRVDVERDKHFSKTNNDFFIKFCQATGCRRGIMEKLEGRDLYSRDEMTATLEGIKKDRALGGNEKMIEMIEEALTYFPDQEYFLFHRNDKGGRFRFAPIIGKFAEIVVERMRNTGENEKVWLHVPVNADIHGYRADYASDIYKMYARDIAAIPYDMVNKGTGKPYQSEVYVCRKDEKGKKLDKAAMLKASKALGHNRIEVVATSYLRNI